MHPFHSNTLAPAQSVPIPPLVAMCFVDGTGVIAAVDNVGYRQRVVHAVVVSARMISSYC